VLVVLAAGCAGDDGGEVGAPSLAGAWQVTMYHAGCPSAPAGSMTLVARTDTELDGTYDIPETSQCSGAFGEIHAVANDPTIYLEVGTRATLTGTFTDDEINASGNISGLTPPDITLWAIR